MRRKGKGKEKEEQLALASALSEIVLSSSDISEIGRGFAFELNELMPVNWAAIGLIEKSTDTLRIFPLSPKLSSEWEPGNSIPLEGTPIAWIAQHKRALLEPDLATESRFWTGVHWLDKGISAIVYMPLFYGGEVFGGLIFGSNRPHAYGERELKLLKYAASQLAAPTRHSAKFVPIIKGQQDVLQSSEEWMVRTEQTLQELTEAIAEYAVHLKSHSSAIQGLSDASQELKQSAAEQNKILADLTKAITERPPGAEPVTVTEPDAAPTPEKGAHPPGCYYSHRQVSPPQTLAEKQRELLKRKGAGKKGRVRPADSKRPDERGISSAPSEPASYRRRLPPPP